MKGLPACLSVCLPVCPTPEKFHPTMRATAFRFPSPPKLNRGRNGPKEKNEGECLGLLLAQSTNILSLTLHSLSHIPSALAQLLSFFSSSPTFDPAMKKVALHSMLSLFALPWTNGRLPWP